MQNSFKDTAFFERTVGMKVEDLNDVSAKDYISSESGSFERSVSSEIDEASFSFRGKDTRNESLQKLLLHSHHAATLPRVPFSDSRSGSHSSTSKNDVSTALRRALQSHLMPAASMEVPMDSSDAFYFGEPHNHLVAPVKQEIMEYGISVKRIYHNSPTAILYEQALKHEAESFITSTGALCCRSGAKTGRSPSDKRIVREPSCESSIWWGKINIPIEEENYFTNRERAIDFLNIQDQLYVVDAFAGWDPEYRISVRIITTRAYHALFMQNMLIMPSRKELGTFVPDMLIYNAGCFPANRYTRGVTSQTHISLHFGRVEMVILGSQYAGEMKKGILTLMMYLMPKSDQLPLHASCNVGEKGDVSLFFGLSGTGKTTLSADVNRRLIGDDEHVWSSKGVFNIEGGCYAKCKNLSRSGEPEIFDAIRFGAILENVAPDIYTRVVDYADLSITENTRCAYPLNHIPNAMIPAIIDKDPSNILMLTCDACGVLPPISLLSKAQAMYHFVSGYTSKVAGTEEGVLESTATFSACFGAPFLPLHPFEYAKLLVKKISSCDVCVWLINTGWIRGRNGSLKGERIPLKYSRAILDAIHSGELPKGEFKRMKVFGLSVPTSVEGVPSDILMPEDCWEDKAAYDESLRSLADLFIKNFEQFCENEDDLVAAGISKDDLGGPEQA